MSDLCKIYAVECLGIDKMIDILERNPLELKRFA